MTKKRYRKILVVLLMINIFVLGLFLFYDIKNSLPDDIFLLINEEEKFDFNLPLKANIESEDIGVLSINNEKIPKNKINIDLNKPFSLGSSKIGKAKVSLKLFGFIHLKSISVDFVNKKEIMPLGETIGININTNGVLVLGSGRITGSDGLSYEPILGKLKSGDYILNINSIQINDKSELMNQVEQSEGNPLRIKYRRKNKIYDTEITPIKSMDGNYKIGAWVRDSTQGIGTMTFITLDGDYGALGHGIADIDTGLLLDISSGDIYNSEIVSIKKGKSGEPGELIGIVKNDSKNRIGGIYSNTEQGIYGEVDNINNFIGKYDLLEVGYKQDIKKGKAYVRCNVTNEIIDYEIEIESIDLSANKDNKGLVIKITDKRLLEITGGIVQGMSGSPIIQDNKIIGAVTHVFVKDSAKGYGTFIENMLIHIK